MKRLFSPTRNRLRQVRHRRVRARVKGTAACPRLSVFRSLRYITAQLVDDDRGETVCSAYSQEAGDGKTKIKEMSGKMADAYLVGKLLAERARAKGIMRAVFDRGGYRYHGRVAALAEGARAGGLRL